MNTEDYVAMRQAELPTSSGTPRPEPVQGPRPLPGPFAALQRLINTAGFVSVDLTDTVFVSLHEERAKARRHINYLE